MPRACVTQTRTKGCTFVAESERAAPASCLPFWMRDLRGVNLIPHEFKWQYGGYYKKCFTAGVAFFRYILAPPPPATTAVSYTLYGGAVAAAAV
jgi:hypothetical protein